MVGTNEFDDNAELVPAPKPPDDGDANADDETLQMNCWDDVMMTLYLNATHGPGGPGFYPESFRVSNGPGACLFLAGARALSWSSFLIFSVPRSWVMD